MYCPRHAFPFLKVATIHFFLLHMCMYMSAFIYRIISVVKFLLYINNTCSFSWETCSCHCCNLHKYITVHQFALLLTDVWIVFSTVIRNTMSMDILVTLGWGWRGVPGGAPGASPLDSSWGLRRSWHPPASSDPGTQGLRGSRCRGDNDSEEGHV